MALAWGGLVLFLFLALRAMALLETYTILTEVAGDSAGFWSQASHRDLEGPEVVTLARELARGNGVDPDRLEITAVQERDATPAGLNRAIVRITLPVGFFWGLTASGVYVVEDPR